MDLRQLARLALQVGIIEALAIHVQEIVVFVVDAPGGAHAEIAEFCRLVRGVPALHDLVESHGTFAGIVKSQPFCPHHGAAERGGVLLANTYSPTVWRMCASVAA